MKDLLILKGLLHKQVYFLVLFDAVLFAVLLFDAEALFSVVLFPLA